MEIKEMLDMVEGVIHDPRFAGVEAQQTEILRRLNVLNARENTRLTARVKAWISNSVRKAFA